MENLTPFNFLHSETILSQFRILADTIANSLPPDNPAKETIRQQVQNISKQQDRWPKYVVTKASERHTPVYSSEDITKLSQSFASYTESINQGRSALKNQLTQDISRLKRSRDETLRQAYANYDRYVADQNMYSHQLTVYSPNDEKHRLVEAQKNASSASYKTAHARLLDEEEKIRLSINKLQAELHPIQLISNQQNVRHLLVKRDGALLGWVPHEMRYVKITASEVPSKEQILRRVSYEPHSKTTNLPLSICKILDFAEELGSSDNQVLSMLLTYLNEHRREVLEFLDTKKTSLPHLIESLSFQCSTMDDKERVLKHLRNFHREKSESFAETVNRFDSLFCFYQYLEKPIETEVVKSLAFQTIRTITPYMISTKCNQAFSSWVKERQKTCSAINTQEIIRIVTHLEQFPDLQLQTTRSLPGFLVTTSLSLPPEETVNISAHFATPCNDTHPLTDSTGPSSDHGKNPFRRNSRPNNKPGGKPQLQNKPTRPGTPSATTPRSSSAGSTGNRTPRQQSKSPGPHRQDSRGRPRSKTPTRTTPRSESQSFVAELDTLAYYSIHSKSPNVKRKSSLPTIFRRPLTPNTYNHLKNTYFYNTSGAERFKDVFTRKKCLRCYGDHRASNCTKFTSPTPVPCRLCVHLFHDTQKCPYFNKFGKSRPATPSRK